MAVSKGGSMVIEVDPEQFALLPPLSPTRWPADTALPDDIQRIVVTAEGRDGDPDFLSVTLPCTLDTFPACLGPHWAARLGRLAGEPISGRHEAPEGSILEVDLSFRGTSVSVSAACSVI